VKKGKKKAPKRLKRIFGGGRISDDAPSAAGGNRKKRTQVRLPQRLIKEKGVNRNEKATKAGECPSVLERGKAGHKKRRVKNSFARGKSLINAWAVWRIQARGGETGRKEKDD